MSEPSKETEENCLPIMTMHLSVREDLIYNVHQCT